MDLIGLHKKNSEPLESKNWWSKGTSFTVYFLAVYFSTSRRIHAIALDKARKLQVTSPAWCRLTYLQFAGEFTRGVIADCLQLQVILRGNAGFFACDCAGIFSCVRNYFCLRLAGIFTSDSSVFACKCMYFCLQKQAILHASHGQICMSSACKTTCKMPVVFR